MHTGGRAVHNRADDGTMQKEWLEIYIYPERHTAETGNGAKEHMFQTLKWGILMSLNLFLTAVRL